MKKNLTLTLTCLLVSAFASAGASDRTEKRLPTCCRTVEKIVHENPKPRYAKDPRQYIVLRKRVQVVVCSTKKHDADCPCETPHRPAKAKPKG
ncbi:MAG: hypothetical protein ACO1SV_24470 [Fimbriimonas sp.]